MLLYWRRGLYIHSDLLDSHCHSNGLSVAPIHAPSIPNLSIKSSIWRCFSAERMLVRWAPIRPGTDRLRAQESSAEGHDWISKRNVWHWKSMFTPLQSCCSTKQRQKLEISFHFRILNATMFRVQTLFRRHIHVEFVNLFRKFMSTIVE